MGKGDYFGARMLYYVQVLKWLKAGEHHDKEANKDKRFAVFKREFQLPFVPTWQMELVHDKWKSGVFESVVFITRAEVFQCTVPSAYFIHRGADGKMIEHFERTSLKIQADGWEKVKEFNSESVASKFREAIRRGTW